jgi:hypothetical protein
MGYYKHMPVVVVAAKDLDQFNLIMERNGYGKLNMTEAVVGATETKKGAAATHYVLECVADDGMLAAIKLALKTISDKDATVEVFSKPIVKIDAVAVSKVDEVLAKKSLSTKTKIDAAIDANVEPKEEDPIPKDEEVVPK